MGDLGLADTVSAPSRQHPGPVEIHDGGGDVDHGGEALIGFVGAERDAFELLERAKKIFDQMPPSVHPIVDGKRFRPARMLGDDDFGAPRVEIGDDGVAVERFVGDEHVESDASRSGATPIVSKRCPGMGVKRTRLPSGSVSARI